MPGTTNQFLNLVHKARVLVKVTHLVVEHGRQRPAQGGNNPAPLRGALSAGPLLADVVGHKLLRSGVVIDDGGAVFAKGVHDLIM